jgi:rhodanese-related sulfurtransferase
MDTTITPKQLSDLKSSGKPVTLLDVRTPIEFQELHVDFAKSVPLDRLSADSIEAALEESAEPLYVICRAGSRGKQACEKLGAAGLNVVNVEGGTLAWEAAGLPVTRGASRVISLERQVRIGAGGLVLLGVMFGSLVHPAFYAFSAFAGAGLVFAGVTDQCGMALLLAKMPWNQVVESRASTRGCSRGKP